MTSATIQPPLEDILSGIARIKQRKIDEVDIPYQRELVEYQSTHEWPTFSFWPFGEKRRKAQEAYDRHVQELNAIWAKYQDHPALKEWAALEKVLPERVIVHYKENDGCGLG